MNEDVECSISSNVDVVLDLCGGEGAELEGRASPLTSPSLFQSSQRRETESMLLHMAWSQLRWPRGCLLENIQVERDPRVGLNSVQRLHIPPGLVTPQDPPGGPGKCC